MKKDEIKVPLNQKLVWPRKCALCLGEASEESPEVFSRKAFTVPYCAACHARVLSLTNLEGGLAMLSLIITIVLWLAVLIFGAIRDVHTILQGSTCAAVIGGGPLTLGVVWLIGKLVLLPYKAINRDKLARPGIKIRKGQDLYCVRLLFANPAYAELFCQANGITR